MQTNIHALSGIRTHDPSNQPTKTHASDRTATVTGIGDFIGSENYKCGDDANLRNYVQLRTSEKKHDQDSSAGKLL
jgi:hypothetical protein